MASALIVEANRYNPIFYPHMTLALGHEHFTRSRFRALVTAVFPTARFGAFEAHYVPRLDRVPRLQHFVEEGLERFPPVRPLLSYNFAVALTQSRSSPTASPTVRHRRCATTSSRGTFAS